jgi:hypothetical protein
MYGAETWRSGISILNILFTSHMHFVGFHSFYALHFKTNKVHKPEVFTSSDGRVRATAAVG